MNGLSLSAGRQRHQENLGAATRWQSHRSYFPFQDQHRQPVSPRIQLSPDSGLQPMTLALPLAPPGTGDVKFSSWFALLFIFAVDS